MRLIDGQLHADEAAVAYFTAVQDRILAAGAVDCLPSPPPTPAVPGSASPVADTALFGDKILTKDMPRSYPLDKSGGVYPMLSRSR